jgi:RNA polymerase sigma-70 factor (ECF subfamily)
MVSSDTRSDAVLIERAQGGDGYAQEVLVRRYLDAAYNVAFARMGESADAEDVVQDAFIRALQSLDECRDAERFGAWLMQIVRNRANDVLRRQKVRAACSLDEVAPPAAPDRTDALAEQGEVEARVEQAMEGLTRLQRAVVQLHTLEDWSHAEVASRLGITEGSARVHLFNARKRLRAALEPTYGPLASAPG